MSDLANELLSLETVPTPIPPHKRCRVSVVLNALNDEDRDALEQLLSPDAKVSSTRVVEVLGRWGHRVSYQSVMRHRRRSGGGGCMCP